MRQNFLGGARGVGSRGAGEFLHSMALPEPAVSRNFSSLMQAFSWKCVESDGRFYLWLTEGCYFTIRKSVHGRGG